MRPATNENFAELIRALVSCQQQAARLSLDFLVQLINMAVLEAALQWDGGGQIPPEGDLQLERLLRLKIRVALAGAGENLVGMEK
jgi:hypothetical protein